MTPEAELDRIFPLGPDSLPQPGVPAGCLAKHTLAASRIYPGTVRDYWIYIPVQYDPARAAAVMIVQDGWDHIRTERRWRMPVIFDNLIHQRAIPVSIGIFINPGIIPATRDGAPERTQRSFEYDRTDDRYARFLLEDILPAVAACYHLATDGNSRMLLGGSSGAFCAFNAAWHRPDAFRRVFSCVGSYTGLRGGHQAASLVRLCEPKPLRLFLEGGGEDLNCYAGDWWTANTAMLSALHYAGYEVNHAWAPQAGHNDYHGSAIFPDALRWLWQDYPAPVETGVNSRQPIVSLTVPGAGWRCANDTLVHVTHLAAGPAGEIFFTREDDPQIYQLRDTSDSTVWARTTAPVGAIAVATDGRLFAAHPSSRRIVALDSAGKEKTLLDDIATESLSVGPDGSLYVADADHRLWLIKPGGPRQLLTLPNARPHRVCLTADGSQLLVSEAAAPVAWQCSVQADGTLAHPEPNYRFITSEDASAQSAGDIATHHKRWSFFVTCHGLQLADHDGRIIGLFNSPAPGSLNGVALGGPQQDELLITCGGKIYRRPLRSPEHLWQ
ncbi:MAG: SMP-30/gluconolactonase/LRE family protein [Opitutaceae bacterium]|nr:SMP-30/gluconolactonase/LRE family protein [Opitutaceae bacterium]MBP9911969.1 SMP-30/gluconolactonase/LRE family protein [Opitutaceae bacterium]